MGFAAVNTGNNLIYLIASAFLSFMGISGLFGKRNIWVIDVDLEAPEEVYAGGIVPLKITVRNRRRFLHGFLISIRVNNESVLFPFVNAGGEASKYLEITAVRRGKYTIPEVHVCSVFPFNFFRRCRGIPLTFEYIVFPRLKRCSLPGYHESRKKTKGETSSNKIGYDGEVFSFRQYVQGDPLKYVNWKATARTGELKTKELSSLARQQVVIDFDKMGIRDIEERASCAAWIIVQSFRKGMPAGLRINNVLHKPGGGNAVKLRMLRELALYGKD